MEKTIFKNEIRKMMLKHILTGKYQHGERLSLSAIAKELEVSVTPIREALNQLSETGIVVYIANRGFFLSELSAAEAQEIYEVMALMESHALKNSKFTNHQLNELIEINKAFAQATESIDILELDRQFHQKLIENYSNNYAIQIIESLRVKISLYEYAFWTNLYNDTSVQMHNDIIQCIKNEDLPAAIKLLEDNWVISVRHILSQLRLVS